MGVLNVAGYYDKLLEFFSSMVTAGFLSRALRDRVLEAGTPELLLEQLSSYTAAHVDKWTKVKV
jgi:predicted Rossmann-fold nucleotide-binding protein